MKIELMSPFDGQPVAIVEAAEPADVADVMTAGRQAATWWWELGWDERRRRLIAWARALAERLEELAQLVHEDMGKPYDDARVEVVGAIGLILWSANNAARVLEQKDVQTGPGFESVKAIVRYRPFGVVGVIGPWNFPVVTPVGVFGFALAAGNAVVFKPSEFTPRVGDLLGRLFADVVPEQPVLQVLQGRGDIGHALIAARPDKVAFTGSCQTGRAVYEQCAQLMIPVLLELGGKNAMIVADDADLDSAARSAAFGAFQNAGQACIGISRLVVHDGVYDAFLAKLQDAAGRIRTGGNGEIGPIVTDRQLTALREHVDDAVQHGARLLLDGRPPAGSRFAGPTILDNVSPDSRIWHEETFAPALIVLRATSLDHAVELANGTEYGLGGSVFSNDNGEAIADRLRSGMTAINSAMTFAYLPGLPFGGVGSSGIGRKHGDEGLREFARSHALAIDASGGTRDGFGRPSQAVDGMVGGLRAALGLSGQGA